MDFSPAETVVVRPKDAAPVLVLPVNRSVARATQTVHCSLCHTKVKIHLTIHSLGRFYSRIQQIPCAFVVAQVSTQSYLQFNLRVRTEPNDTV